VDLRPQADSGYPTECCTFDTLTLTALQGAGAELRLSVGEDARPADKVRACPASYASFFSP